MRKFAGSIDQSLLNNVKYRNKVVTGVVAVDNGNYTYDTYISSSDDAYPNIPTTMREPDFAVGDAVEILMEYGNKEMPIIIGLAKKVVQEVEVIDINPVEEEEPVTHNIYIVCDNGAGTYYIKSYTNAGILIDTWTIESTLDYGNPITVDVAENVYTISGNTHSIRKRNSSGELTLTKTETNDIYNIAVGTDGYIYTEEKNSTHTNAYIAKRNASDLVTIDTLVTDATGVDLYCGLVIDSNSKFYWINKSHHRYETWGWVAGLEASSTGTIEEDLPSLATVGSNLTNIDWMSHAILLPKNYSDGGVGSDIELTDITSPGALGTFGNYYLVSGYDSGNKVCIGKYDTSLTKVWVTQVGSYNYGCVAAYPF